MTNYMKLSYLIVTALFLGGVLYLWNNSIQDRKYQDIVTCWEKELDNTNASELPQLTQLCDILSTHNLGTGVFAPFSSN